jgi:hypothetical protein
MTDPHRKLFVFAAALFLAAGLAAAPPPRQAPCPARCCQDCKCQPCSREGEVQKRKGQRFQNNKEADHQADMAIFHYLLEHRKQISRTVKNLPDGVETFTESKDREVAAKIQEHAQAMHRRVKEGRPIHMRDPLFREIFRHADKVTMIVEKIKGGVRVKETSKDAYVVKLIQAHARVVSAFLANGHDEVRKNHSVPQRPIRR